MKKLIIAATMILFSVTTFIISCKKEMSTTTSSNNNTNNPANKVPPRLKVYLTDAPVNYDSVIIDVQNVQINYTTDSTSGWQNVPNISAGTYNILDLLNGKDTLLTNVYVPAGTVNQIRVLLGSNNYVVISGLKFPLTTPSAQQSGLKLNVNQRLDSGLVYSVVIDFVASQSIVVAGNSGKYILKPVIKATFQTTTLAPVTGNIKGVVMPDSFRTAVFAIYGVDTVSTFTDSTGNYFIGNLNPNMYNMLFVPGDTTYTVQTKSGINVMAGNTTIVDTVRLHH